MNSKLSAQTFNDPEVAARIKASKAFGLMTINAPDLLADIGNGDGRVAVGRLQTTETGAMMHVNPYANTAEYVAQLWMDACLPICLQYPHVYWTYPINEGGNLESLDWMNWYNDIAVAWQNKMKAWGLRCVLFNFSVEANIYDKFQPLVPALKLASQLGNLYGTHGYSSPRLASDIDLLLNHRKLRAALGWIPKTVYAEFGADQIHGNGINGWRQSMGEDEYYSDLTFIDSAYLMTDPDVVGAFIYCWTKEGGRETDYGLEPSAPYKGHYFAGVGNMLLDWIEDNPARPFYPATPTEPPAELPAIKRVAVTRYSNLRTTPSGASRKRGHFEAGETMEVDYRTKRNGYVQEVDHGWWIWANNLKDS